MKKYTKRERGEFEESSSSDTSINNLLMNQVHNDQDDEDTFKIKLNNHEF